MFCCRLPVVRVCWLLIAQLSPRRMLWVGFVSSRRTGSLVEQSTAATNALPPMATYISAATKPRYQGPHDPRTPPHAVAELLGRTVRTNDDSSRLILKIVRRTALEPATNGLPNRGSQ